MKWWTVNFFLVFVQAGIVGDLCGRAFMARRSPGHGLGGGDFPVSAYDHEPLLPRHGKL